MWNPCRAALPAHLLRHELVAAAWDGIDAAEVWDSHAHLLGTGDAGSGIYVNPRMESLLHPALYARRLFFLNAGCAQAAPGDVDRSYVARMRELMEGMRPGAKILLFAFERAHDEAGRPNLDETAFYVPDSYARDVARADPQFFEWAASIHPYRRDCVEALHKAKADGARAVKWLPAAMGIDPASALCRKFFEAMQKLDLPLITHAGEERAVLGHVEQDAGNPLRLRPALDAGVRVVVAHCASMGADRDLDRGGVAESFALFARLMGEKRYEKNLFGDLSAITQANRAGGGLARVLEEEAWHPRLLNGSDYPLPGVMPIYSLAYLVSLKLIEERAAPVLREIRLHNPLLFDFVLKRHLRSSKKALPARVFETRRFFVR